MRVASNKIKDLGNFYQAELSGKYEPGEIRALFEHSVNHYLGIPIGEITRRQDENVNQSELLKIYDCAKLLATRIPLQYILGEVVFYGLKLRVNNNVLIPRPETEELVDLVVKENKTATRVLDIGTGSGCIALGIKSGLRHAQVWACDISPAALAVAGQNARLNQLETVFFEADALDTENFLKDDKTCFDVIISNPPYINLSEHAGMDKQVTDHEPHLALFVNDDDAIVFYRKIIDLCRTKLNIGGNLYFELNPLTADKVKEYASGSGYFEKPELIKDMSGNIRFLKAIKTK